MSIQVTKISLGHAFINKEFLKKVKAFLPWRTCSVVLLHQPRFQSRGILHAASHGVVQGPSFLDRNVTLRHASNLRDFFFIPRFHLSWKNSRSLLPYTGHCDSRKSGLVQIQHHHEGAAIQGTRWDRPPGVLVATGPACSQAGWWGTAKGLECWS